MLREAMKARDELAKGLLRVVLGEVSTRRARTGQEPTGEEVQGIIRKVMAGNDETRRELERHGQTDHEAYGRLARENAYLQTLLPQTLNREAIRNELQPIVADLRGAKNDGQAMGLAMKHLKGKGLAVLGEDVAAAVRDVRAG
jgi:uncharacterized protein YqeY